MRVLKVSSPSRSLFRDSLNLNTCCCSARRAGIMLISIKMPAREAGWSRALITVFSEHGLELEEDILLEDETN